MRTVEIFSGTKSFSKVMAARGHDTFTVDFSPEYNPDTCADVLKWSAPVQLIGCDILWMSPPCTCFSVASIGTHWKGGWRAYEPRTEEARNALRIVDRALEIRDFLHPKWWFIENPQGVLKKMPQMQGMKMHTIWYCHYGDSRAKPTNIWTNADWWVPRPVCHNRRQGHPSDCCCMDHDAAPRGAKTGTQGLSGAMARGVIPPQLFEEILSQMP